MRKLTHLLTPMFLTGLAVLIAILTGFRVSLSAPTATIVRN
jgi:hypothetical protein